MILTPNLNQEYWTEFVWVAHHPFDGSFERAARLNAVQMPPRGTPLNKNSSYEEMTFGTLCTFQQTRWADQFHQHTHIEHQEPHLYKAAYSTKVAAYYWSRRPDQFWLYLLATSNVEL